MYHEDHTKKNKILIDMKQSCGCFFFLKATTIRGAFIFFLGFFEETNVPAE